ncbi:MAG: PEP-CTERM sorting domain-containing protein [Rhodospirillales bacterium]
MLALALPAKAVPILGPPVQYEAGKAPGPPLAISRIQILGYGPPGIASDAGSAMPDFADAAYSGGRPIDTNMAAAPRRDAAVGASGAPDLLLPEPASLAVLVFGLTIVGVLRRRRKAARPAPASTRF